jgi:hypothetical protein
MTKLPKSRAIESESELDLAEHEIALLWPDTLYPDLYDAKMDLDQILQAVYAPPTRKDANLSLISYVPPSAGGTFLLLLTCPAIC